MKILHCVQYYHPAVGGMEEVVKQLSERLSALGHDVTVLTSTNQNRLSNVINDVKIADFNISGNLANGISGDTKACIKFMQDNEFDIITCFAAQQWATDLLLQDNLLFSLPGKKIFVPTGFSGLYQEQYHQYFDSMKEWIKLFDANVFLSNDYRDINFAREHNANNLVIIPNGAAKDEFESTQIKNIFDKKYFNILHVGNHTGQKGHKDLFKILPKLKRDNIQIHIVGSKKITGRCYLKCVLKSFFYNLYFKILNSKKRVYLHTFSRSEVLSAYHDADLFLFPSNIECSPIVLFESMASKTPFATSSAGNAEEIINWSNAGVLLPGAKDKYGTTQINLDASIHLLNDLIEDESKLARLSEDGFKAWSQKFTWEAISKDYEKLYFTLLRGEQ